LIFAEIPKRRRYLYLLGTIIIVIKPLYGILESSIYWFITYNKYYIEELLIIISLHDLYLFINTTKRPFVILVIQTNNTLFLVNKQFVDLKKKKGEKIYYKTKGDIKPRKPFYF
jgi:hypothetical protein